MGTAGLWWAGAKGWEAHLDAEYVDSRIVLNPRSESIGTEVADYLILNGRIAYSFELPSQGSVTVSLNLENVTDTDSANRPDYPMPGFAWLLGIMWSR